MQTKDPTPHNIANVSLACSMLALIICFWPGFDATSRYGVVILFFLVAVAFTLAIINYWGKRSERACWRFYLRQAGW